MSKTEKKKKKKKRRKSTVEVPITIEITNIDVIKELLKNNGTLRVAIDKAIEEALAGPDLSAFVEAMVIDFFKREVRANLNIAINKEFGRITGPHWYRHFRFKDEMRKGIRQCFSAEIKRVLKEEKATVKERIKAGVKNNEEKIIKGITRKTKKELAKAYKERIDAEIKALKALRAPLVMNSDKITRKFK